MSVKRRERERERRRENYCCVFLQFRCITFDGCEKRKKDENEILIGTERKDDFPPTVTKLSQYLPITSIKRFD